jgi:hypothetical protein
LKLAQDEEKVLVTTGSQEERLWGKNLNERKKLI